MAACVCDMFQNTQAQRLYFPSAFSDCRWECRTICNGGEITEVKLGFSWRNTPVGWRKYGPCLWHQLGGGNMDHVCDTTCLVQIRTVSVTPVGWRKYGPCLWHQQFGAFMDYVCETSFWRKYDPCLWQPVCGANMLYVCDTSWVAQICPMTVTPVGVVQI